MPNPFRLAFALSAVLWWAGRGLADFVAGVAAGEAQATKPLARAQPLSRDAARDDLANAQREDGDMASQRCSNCAINHPTGTRSCPVCGETTWYCTSDAGGSGMAAKSVTCEECGNCGAEAWGFTQGELLKDGWGFHSIPASKTAFVLCGECEAEYAVRRAIHAEAAA